jgi:RNA polymerase-binding transcription factor DksA
MAKQKAAAKSAKPAAKAAPKAAAKAATRGAPRKGGKAGAKSTVEIIRQKAASRAGQIKKATANLKKAAAVRAAALKKAAAERAVLEKKLGPKMYTQKELEGFRTLIMEKRKESVEELDTLKESSMDVTTGEYISESSNYSLHMEQGTDAMEREKTFLFLQRGTKFVNQLDEALQRIDAKSYGVCKACGLLIPKERLEAVPTAQTCAEYKNTNHPCERGKIALALRKKAELE